MDIGECAWTTRVNNHWPRRPEEFPRGLAETGGFGIRELKDELRSRHDPAYVPEERPPFTPLLFDLGYGEVFDAGLRDYGEFFVNLEYGWELLHRGALLLGRWGRVSVIGRFANAVQLKWEPT